MEQLLPENLKELAKNCPFPLYVVGGSVRDFLLNYIKQESDFTDFDICAPVSPEVFLSVAKSLSFQVHCVYSHTGTVKLSDKNGICYEFSSFRSDEYICGKHTPAKITFTQDIEKDAKRRDFTCNAIYYDIVQKKFCDPLSGIKDIEEKRICCANQPEKVFSEDGLRLMRLARQAAQTNLMPTEETIYFARKNCNLIEDIAPERIFCELQLILHADEKYGIKYAQYQGLKLLDQIGVLEKILPELTNGRGLEQRKEFHNYDVLEHSLRCVKYAPSSIRLAALLHDIGKPFCFLRDGNYFLHPQEGTILAEKILNRWKAPKKTIKEVCDLVACHMYDARGDTRPNKLRQYLVAHYSLLPKLLLIKQADFSACKDNLSICPTDVRWNQLLQQMKEENTPFTLKDLKVNGKELIENNIPPAKCSEILEELLLHCSFTPQDNQKEILLLWANRILKEEINKE